jgi:hypothetical protein
MADSKQAVAQGRGRDRRGGVFRRRQLRAQGEQEIPENLFARGFHLVCGLRYCEQSVQLLRRNFAARCDRRCTSSQSTQSRALTISPDSHRQSHPPTIPARWRVGPRSIPLPQQLRQPSEVHRHAPGLVAGEHLGLAGGLFVVAEIEPPTVCPPASCTQNDSSCSTVQGGGKRSFEEPAAAVYEPKNQPRSLFTGQHPSDLFRWD